MLFAVNIRANDFTQTPFEPDEEEAVLKLLRKRKEPWPCFPPGSAEGECVHVHGHHERYHNRQKRYFQIHIEDEEQLPQTLELFNPETVRFFVQLATRISINFPSKLSAEDRKAFCEIIRFTVLGKTSWCCKNRSENILATAHTLLNHQRNQSVATGVYDLLSKPLANCAHNGRVLVQNEQGQIVFGSNVFGSPLIQGEHLFTLFLAIVGAYLRSGVCIHVLRQSLGGKQFEMSYFVDQVCGLLVVCATELHNV